MTETLNTVTLANALFPTGNIYMTKGIDMECKTHKSFIKEIAHCILRHISGDYSDMRNRTDRQLNYDAIQNGYCRIVSTYDTSMGRIYIITESDRSYTTVLLPDEY